MAKGIGACEEKTVASLYQDEEVAETYLQKRLGFSWSRLLHETQVKEVNRVISEYRPETVVEIAPGPARLTTEVRGIQGGILIEYSEEMIALAKRRLKTAGVDSLWDVRHGNAFDLRPELVQGNFFYTFRFIRHFNHEERTRLYHNIRSCLKPRGLLMFDVVNTTGRKNQKAQRGSDSRKNLDVYDVTYSSEDFYSEMQAHGFSVISLRPVIHFFEVQAWISHHFDSRLGRAGNALVRFLDHLPSSNPLEWIALCRKVD